MQIMPDDWDLARDVELASPSMMLPGASSPPMASMAIRIKKADSPQLAAISWKLGAGSWKLSYASSTALTWRPL